MSNIELSIDGERVVKVEVNMAVLFTLLQSVSPRAVSSVVPTSTVATREQIAELLSRIDARSVQFLKQIAANDDGAITWGEMRTIFGFKNVGDWAAFSGSFGKGITRALRHILGDKSARLVWWDDSEWPEDPNLWDSCEVYVDGPSLQALREAVGVAKSG